MPFLTIAGENKLAQNQSVSGGLNIVSFVLANVPNLGAEPADRISALPNPSLIVDTLPFTRRGYVNPNQVVYSLVMGSNVGDYDFNWIGLIDDDGVLVAVSHISTIQKRKNVGAIPGNTITRNFLLKYTGIQEITATTVPVETWQIDFGTRLTGIDERERLANLDIYGHEGFLEDGWKVTGSAGTYSVADGIGYVGGVRAKNTALQQITTSTFPNEIWLNVSLQGDISDMAAVCEFVIDTGPFADYVDGNGVEHYLTKIADIDENGDVVDVRSFDSMTQHTSDIDPHPQYATNNDLNALKIYADSRFTSASIMNVSGTADEIVLTSKEGVTPITEIKDFDEFSFIVAETNTNAVTIKIDELNAISLSGIVSATQIFETALLTVRYIEKYGAFCVVSQINPKTGNSVADIAKLITDTTDVLYLGEYALDGSAINSADHPIACAKAAATSNYINQATKDADPIEYGGFYGFVDELDGSTTVTLPMVGGEFIRMFDDGRGVDPDRVFAARQKGTVASFNERWDGTLHGAEANFPVQGNSQAYLDALGLDKANPIDYLSVRALAISGANPEPNFLTSGTWGGGVSRPHSIAYFGKTRL